MKTLGVSMIVKNEAECITACLESVKDADEIVICDTGSEDNTVELCRKYTDKVYTDYKWNDDFSEARNHALDKSTTDYVLIIDADEVLTDTIQSVKAVLNSGFMHKYKGMTFIVKTRVETIESCRIIKRTPEIRWHGAVHNVLVENGSSESLKRQCYKSRFKIDSGYSPAHMKDPDRSLRILQKQLDISPDNTRYMYYIAREYISRRMLPENKERINEYLDLIIYWLEKYEKIAFFQDWTNELADALYCLGLAYIEKKRWHDAVLANMKSFLVLPTYKAPARFLQVAFTDMPGGNKYPAASMFWGAVAKQANNEGVAQIRDIK